MFPIKRNNIEQHGKNIKSINKDRLFSTLVSKRIILYIEAKHCATSLFLYNMPLRLVASIVVVVLVIFATLVVNYIHFICLHLEETGLRLRLFLIWIYMLIIISAFCTQIRYHSYSPFDKEHCI